jgi:hypothetical protein
VPMPAAAMPAASIMSAAASAASVVHGLPPYARHAPGSSTATFSRGTGVTSIIG